MNPLWMAVTRFGVLLGVTLRLKSFREGQLRERNEIRPHRIYSSHEASILLSVERAELVNLVTQKKIMGRMVNGNYRIPGSSLLSYLKHDEVA